MTYQLGFIGAGNMAEAIARAAIDKGVLSGEQIIAADPTPARRQVFADLGITVTESNADVVAQSEQVLLAIKPQTLTAIANELRAHLHPQQVVISIMAGIRTARLAEALAKDGQPPRLVRVMPNTPMLVGRGMAAIALGPGAQAGDEALAMRLFAAGGEAVRVDEPMLDAITAVSGSGPAYVFYLAEAMEQAARDMGLDEHARLLVSQTLLGAAHLLSASPEDAAELRRRVTSPGGTTEAAIKHLEAHGVRGHIVDALKAAEARSKELGR